MKVLYDFQTFALQDFGGVSLVFSELIRYYQSIPERITAKAFAPFSGNINLQVVQPQLSWEILHRISSPFRLKLQFQANKQLSKLALALNNFSVFHPTYYNPYFLPYLKKPFVITIHDMAHEVFADDPAFHPNVRKNKRLLAEKATKIIAISEATKREILRFYDSIPEEKIEVIYHAGDQILRPEHYDAGNFASILPSRYIVYDGTRKAGYKNFRPFLTAIAPILNKDRDLYVVCAGGLPFTSEEKEFFATLDIGKQMINIPLLGSMPMQAIFWKNATLFAYPSLYEGFGIPIVQSMFCECPVVGHNAGSTPEVGADAIYTFDGRNTDSIYTTVHEALYNKESRARKIALGIKRAQEFTWKKTAENTLKLYHSITE